MFNHYSVGLHRIPWASKKTEIETLASLQCVQCCLTRGVICIKGRQPFLPAGQNKSTLSQRWAITRQSCCFCCCHFMEAGGACSSSRNPLLLTVTEATCLWTGSNDSASQMEPLGHSLPAPGLEVKFPTRMYNLLFLQHSSLLVPEYVVYELLDAHWLSYIL